MISEIINRNLSILYGKRMLLMNISLSAGLSGIQAASFKESVSADNIANSTTDGFEKYNVSQAESTNMSGVKISSISRTPNNGVESNTDLATEMVNQISNKNEFSGDLSVIKTQDKMTGALLDIMA
jgi:flagellar hook protein FlgE